MIPIRSKSTEDVIKADLTGVYATFEGSKYTLFDRGSKFTSKQFTWLANELGFIKVYTSPYTPTGNSVVEWTHAFLKASPGKLICNHNIHWDEIAHIATMAYNVFLHSSAREAPFYSVFGHDTFIPTLFKLLLPKLRYMNNGKCRILLDAMWEIYMMARLNFKTSRHKCPPPVRDPDKTDFKMRHGFSKEPYPKRSIWFKIQT